MTPIIYVVVILCTPILMAFMIQMQLSATQTLVYIRIIQGNGQTFTCNIAALIK